MGTNWHDILIVYYPSVSEKSENHLNLLRSIGAALGWFTLGLFLCLTKYYKTANIWIGFLSLVCWILIPFVFKMNLTSISILYGFMGFWAYTVSPFWLIYSVEIAYPLKETTVVGIVRGTAGFISNSIAYALYYFIKKHKGETIWIVIICMMAASTAIGLLFAIIIKPLKSKVIKGGDICKFRYLINQFSD